MTKRELRYVAIHHGFLKRMWKFSDLYTVCAMGHDEVNFWHVLQRAMKSHKLLWNEEQTPMIYDILENQMPDKWFELWLHVKDINCGDPIPAEIVNVLNILDPADAADIAALHEANAEVIIADDVEGDDPNIDERTDPWSAGCQHYVQRTDSCETKSKKKERRIETNHLNATTATLCQSGKNTSTKEK